MKHSAIIIEDEALARVTLKNYLKKYFPEITVVAEIDNKKDALKFLLETDATILFLDVELSDGKALELLESIDSSKFRIVFTTAYEEFTLEAFRHKAFGYLLKPIDPLDFKTIIDRVILDAEGSRNSGKKIRIPISGGSIWIDLNDIVRCESQGNYTRIICQDDSKNYLISKTLKYVEQNLINSSKFVRVHQSHLINTFYLTRNAIQKGQIILQNGDKLPVSRSKKLELIDALMNR